MSTSTLTLDSKLMCPHGGTVQIVSTNTRVTIDGAFAALASDTFTITGCPFQIPATPPIPSPCVKVQWVMTDSRTSANQTRTLSQASSGLCLAATQAPQGPVVVSTVQLRAKSQ